MILVGLGFLVYWLLLQLFTITDIKAAVITAIIFIVLGVLIERPWTEVKTIRHS